MAHLQDLDLADMVMLGGRLRSLGDATRSMESVATDTVRYLRGELLDGAGRPACALVRFFKTHPYGALPGELREAALGMLGGRQAHDELRCLTLLGTDGELPEWRDRRGSRGHQAIPLVDEEFVASAPMIAALAQQLGVTARTLVAPTPDLFREAATRSFNVFHVPEAAGSPLVPAQSGFVLPHRIRSVVGFGGALPSGDIYAVILFSRVRVAPHVADLFKTLSLGLKVAVLGAGERVFS